MSLKFQILGSKKTISFADKDLVGSGGQGSVYALNGCAYKIYSDWKKMIPEGKINELSVLDHPQILRPKPPFLLKDKKVVGCSMDYVSNAYVLVQLFTKAFRRRNSVSPEMCWHLVKELEKLTKFIHSKNVLIVDYNSFNVLVNETFNKVYLIDVDSYQTKSYPATAIMKDIRDYNTNGFNVNTDWFSYAILTFNLMLGIHPFKGKHPSLSTIEERVKANVSILNPQVSYPKGPTFPLDVIPKHYLHWYKDLFEKGKRLPPPDIDGKVIIVVPTIEKIKGADKFLLDELFKFNKEIIDVTLYRDCEVVVTSNQIYLNRKLTGCPFTENLKVFLKKDSFHPIAAFISNDKLELYDLEKNEKINCNLLADKIFTYQGRLYLKQNDQISEVECDQIGNKIIPFTKLVSKVLPNLVKIHDGVIVERIFGTHYFSIFPEESHCFQIRIPEVEKYKIIDAKFEKGLLCLIGFHTTEERYDRFFIYLDNQSYQIVLTENVLHTGINFTVLDNGICVFINEEDQVEIFNVRNLSKKRTIEDKTVNHDMKLRSIGAKTVFFKGESIYSLTMS